MASNERFSAPFKSPEHRRVEIGSSQIVSDNILSV